MKWNKGKLFYVEFTDFEVNLIVGLFIRKFIHFLLGVFWHES